MLREYDELELGDTSSIGEVSGGDVRRDDGMWTIDGLAVLSHEEDEVAPATFESVSLAEVSWG